MNINSFNNTLTLLSRVSNTRQSTEAFITPLYDKPVVKENSDLCGLETATPESQGIDSQVLLSFVQELNADKTLNMHDIVILRNGKIICQTAFGEQDLGIWKYTFSACKSVTSLAVGLLMDDGLLKPEDKVISFFEEYATPVIKLKLKDLTVEHLLTMTSGVYFNEAESMTVDNWVQAFLNSMMVTDPGKAFNYNSLNTYMLSAIISKITGRDMFDFLMERLFTPLGITDVYWEKCPRGISKGGWGLYIRPYDFAKIGLLVMNHGVYDGQRIISEEYIKLATSQKQVAPKEYGAFNYAYQMWCGRKHRSFLFNGMLGQNVLGFWDSNILIVSNAGNDESFQQSNYFKIALKYFGDSKAFSGKSLPENPLAYLKLKDFLAQLDSGDIQRPMMRFWNQLTAKMSGNFPKEAEAITDRTWFANSDITNSMGVLPLCIQVLQNNYTKGFVSVGFKKKDGNLVLVYTETDVTYEFPIGFSQVMCSDVSFNGEPFHVAVTGRFLLSEEGCPMLRVQLSFVETPFTRLLKFYFLDADELDFVQDEMPGATFVSDFLYGMKEDYGRKPFFGNTLNKFNMDYIDFKIERTFRQKLHMRLVPQDK